MHYSEQQFLWALQALAQPPEVQPTLFPPIVVVADELALEFSHWRQVAETEIGESWTAAQRAAIAALDKMLTSMSGPDKAELWLEREALYHPKWCEVRQLAEVALTAFGWQSGLPPLDRTTYLPGS